jgi:hypothetical protein
VANLSAVHGHGYGAGGRIQFRRRLLVCPFIAFARQEVLEHLELPFLARGAKFFAQARQTSFEQRDRPALLVNFVRRPVIHRLQLIALFRLRFFEGQDFDSAAAFPGAGFSTSVKEKMFERSQQKCPKLAAPRIGADN